MKFEIDPELDILPDPDGTGIPTSRTAEAERTLGGLTLLRYRHLRRV